MTPTHAQPILAHTRIPGPAGAPVLVLGPSLGTTTAVWAAAATRLARRFTVIAWDLPGHGESPAARAGFELADLADAVSDLIDAPTYFYAGVSLGGAVGLHLALRDSRLSALVSVCSGARIGSADGWQARAGVVRASGTGALVSGSRERWFAPGALAPELRGLLEALPLVDDDSYAFCCEALARYDVSSRLPEITIPVLAVFGDCDTVTPESDSREIASRVGEGRVLGLTEAGHLAPAEQPDRISEVLGDFFAQAGTGIA